MAETVIKRHPIRGFLYGIVFGLGLVLLAVGQGWVALGTTPPVLLFIAGIVIGTLWGTYGPAKPPKGPPPPEPVEVEQRDAAAADTTDEPTSEAAAATEASTADASEAGEVSDDASAGGPAEPPAGT